MDLEYLDCAGPVWVTNDVEGRKRAFAEAKRREERQRREREERTAGAMLGGAATEIAARRARLRARGIL